ncbi:TraB/GumN family protein [Stakelama saccharophila]|uniref:TraB/GumN family protein n=1 Tax=Stakelama saccharophila TaxID=3075605 RepID=A0ABZ0B7G3_9SPHN|nr:TraB/GumN family protein [Stakelama sp. W311]WNO53339.1 TraB/GumN family protein [Stakelama sp. W311]
MMICKLLSGAALAAFALAAPAAAQTADAAPAAATTRDADPALWVVKDDDTTIYLFGTVHVLKPGLSWFDDAVKQAFDASDELVLEIRQPDGKAMQKLMLQYGLDPEQAPLSETLPEGLGARYLKAMAGIGIPQAAADRFEPWFAATLLSVAPLQKLGYDPVNGPEAVLTAAAEAAKKKLGALETPEQQLGYLDSLSDEAQIAFLTSTLEDMDEAQAMMDAMVDRWSSGDPQALGKLLNDELTDSPELQKILLTDRNANWADWIDTRLDTPGTVFVAVGAGHLAGEGSVQEQLAAHDLIAARIDY